MEWKYLIQFLKKNDHFIICCHETPDGDAVGSEYALYCALKALGKKALILNADPPVSKFGFLDKQKVIKVLRSPSQLPKNLSDYCLVILDTNDINNIGQIRDMVLPYIKDYFIIDHHDSNKHIVKKNLIVENASSTCEILYGVFEHLKIAIDYSIALALFVGIVYDSGSFIYPKTTSRTFEIATKLVAMGINPNMVYSKIYESATIESLLLQKMVLSSLELYYDQKVAVQYMHKADLLETGALYEDADSIINIPLRSAKIRVSIFFKENDEGNWRCSLRSKGNINVYKIAQKMGGGGHKTAAGFKCRQSMEKTKELVLAMLQNNFKSKSR